MIDFKGVRRTLRALLCLAFVCLVACGGGGGGPAAPAPEAAWTTIPDFTLSMYGEGKVTITSTEAGGHNVGDGVFELQCTVTSRGYWPMWTHLAVITRADTELPGSLWGAGLAIGKTGDVGAFSIVDPRAVIETWALGAGPLGGMGNRDSILYQDSLGPILVDDMPYPFAVQNIVKGGQRFIHYTMAGYDSGTHADANTLYDTTETGVILADASRLPGSWALEFTSCRHRWSAA